MNRRPNPARELTAGPSKRTRGRVSLAEESVASNEDPAGGTAAEANPRKARKVSRACDYCKTRKVELEARTDVTKSGTIATVG